MEDSILKQVAVKAANKGLAQLEKQFRPDSDPIVKQAKIVRDKVRLDQKGRGRSKRFAFIEFQEHGHALAALRFLNNNPLVFGKNHRPIVEFALDDHRKLLKRNKRAQGLVQRQAAIANIEALQTQEANSNNPAGDNSGSDDDSSLPPVLTKHQKRQIKRNRKKFAQKMEKRLRAEGKLSDPVDALIAGAEVGQSGPEEKDRDISSSNVQEGEETRRKKKKNNSTRKKLTKKEGLERQQVCASLSYMYIHVFSHMYMAVYLTQYHYL